MEAPTCCPALIPVVGKDEAGVLPLTEPSSGAAMETRAKRLIYEVLPSRWLWGPGMGGTVESLGPRAPLTLPSLWAVSAMSLGAMEPHGPGCVHVLRTRCSLCRKEPGLEPCLHRASPWTVFPSGVSGVDSSLTTVWPTSAQRFLRIGARTGGLATPPSQQT